MISQAELHELFEYCRDTGALTYRVNVSCKMRAGARAGTVKDSGYRGIVIRGKRYLEHRIVWVMAYGELPDGEIDHVNRVKDDNRLANLRACSRNENNHNRVLLSLSKEGFRGVRRQNKSLRYEARIMVNGKHLRLGTFSTAAEAGAAYQSAADKYHREFVPQ